MGYYCFARWRLSSVVVYNTASWRDGRADGRAADTPGGPVVLRQVRATPC